MDRWTIKQLNMLDDIDFAARIISERKNCVSPLTPLGKKLASAYDTLSNLKRDQSNLYDTIFDITCIAYELAGEGKIALPETESAMRMAVISLAKKFEAEITSLPISEHTPALRAFAEKELISMWGNEVLSDEELKYLQIQQSKEVLCAQCGKKSERACRNCIVTELVKDSQEDVALAGKNNCNL